MSCIEFEVPGDPVGKQRVRIYRARSRRFGYAIRGFTPEKTREYEAKIRLCFLHAIPDITVLKPSKDYVELDITVYIGIPKATSKKKTEEMLKNLILPTRRPDIDNVLKTVMDALTGALYRDDSQVVAANIQKYYSRVPRLRVKFLIWDREGR